jgi:hypothetical protein
MYSLLNSRHDKKLKKTENHLRRLDQENGEDMFQLAAGGK